MKQQTRLMSVFQVHTTIHSTWYLAFILMVWVMATQFSQQYPLWQRLAFGATGTILFLAVVLVRQLLLDLLAIAAGVPLKNVTVYVFGGATRLPEDVTSPAIEALMAGVGLLLNVIIAGVFEYLTLTQTVFLDNALTGLIQWSAFVWYMLAILHVVPGFPLEGGRLLQAVMWKVTGDYGRAARVVLRIGSGLGLVLAVSGIVLLAFYNELSNGPLLSFLGWVLLRAAGGSRRRLTLLEALRHTKAGDIIAPEFRTIGPGISLGEVVFSYAMANGQDYFTVSENGHLLGVLRVAQIRSVPKDRWWTTTAGEVMTPAHRVNTVQSGETADHVIEQMDQSGSNHVPILNNNELVGVVVRNSLTRLARIRASLKLW